MVVGASVKAGGVVGGGGRLLWKVWRCCRPMIDIGGSTRLALFHPYLTRISPCFHNFIFLLYRILLISVFIYISKKTGVFHKCSN